MSLEKISKLLKDLFALCQELRRINLNPAWLKVATLLRAHYKLLVPVCGFAVEYLISYLPIDNALRQILCNKLAFIVQSVSVSFRFALVFVFLYQVSFVCILLL